MVGKTHCVLAQRQREVYVCAAKHYNPPCVCAAGHTHVHVTLTIARKLSVGMHTKVTVVDACSIGVFTCSYLAHTECFSCFGFSILSLAPALRSPRLENMQPLFLFHLRNNKPAPVFLLLSMMSCGSREMSVCVSESILLCNLG